MAFNRFVWTQEAVEIIINNWETEPALFDKNDASYYSQQKRDTAIIKIKNEICSTYPGSELTVLQIRYKMAKLRTQYSRERRRLEDKSGETNNAEIDDLSPWWYNRLHFLKKYILPRKSKSDRTNSVSYSTDDSCSHRNGLDHSSDNRMGHIRSIDSSFEWNHSRPSLQFIDPAAVQIANIKEEEHDYSYQHLSDALDNVTEEGYVNVVTVDDSLSLSDTDEDLLHSEYSGLEKQNTPKQAFRKHTSPNERMDRLKAFAQFLVASLAEIKDEKIANDAEESCMRAIYAARSAWLIKKETQNHCGNRDS